MSIALGQPLLQVDNLDVAYRNLRVLFQISFQINTGEILVVVGRNGAGKTTFFRTLAGFLKPEKGSVLFKGENIGGMRAFQIARMGLKYIPQDKQVFGNLTVRQNMELGGYATGDYDFDSVLVYFPKLTQLMERKAGLLSGGERQMLMIARALLGNPDLLLLDEPTEGLAPHVVTDLTTSFKKISEKTTLAIIEQDLPLTSRIADRVYCMKEGKIVAETRDQKEVKELAFEKFL